MSILVSFKSKSFLSFFSFVCFFLVTFVLNWYEFLFNCACIKGNTDSLSCFCTSGFVSSERALAVSQCSGTLLDSKPSVQKHNKESLFPDYNTLCQKEVPVAKKIMANFEKNYGQKESSGGSSSTVQYG